jgi:1-acyl-sn-glycerol-3-phosphate acyltransferase
MDIIKSIIVWLIGICFTLTFFPLTLIIWLLVLPFDRERSVIHWLLQLQSKILVSIVPIWKIKTDGREKAVKGTTYVIISNHQSILDILLMNSLRYRYKWVSKSENETLPVLGWYLKMAGYITVDRGDELSKVNMLEKSERYLKSGISVMIFPEGTRSYNNEIGFFKRGAFQLAIRANVPILPVLIDGAGGILPKHGLILGSGFHVSIKVLDPVLPSSFGTENQDELALKMQILMTGELKKLRETH